MNRKALLLAVAMLSLALSLPLIANLPTTQAQNNYTIQHVDHNIQVVYSGNVIITDRITLSGQIPSSFQMGFPFKYGSYILEATAYDTNFNILPVALGVQLQDQTGFYGVTVTLPAGTAQTFTIAFVLSTAPLTQTFTGYTLDFPAYPSFTQSTNEFNVTLTLPSGATTPDIDKPDGAVNGTGYTAQNVAAFTYAPATASFSIEPGRIQQAIIPTLNRRINVSSQGALSGTDSYRIVNNSTGVIGSFLINLPVQATNIVARDQFGTTLTTTVQQSNNVVLVHNVTLALAINPGASTDVTLDYSLPGISPSQSRYTLNLDLFPYFNNYYVESASVTVTLPEGATITSPQLGQIGPSAQVSRNIYQESLTVNRQGVSLVDSTIPSQDVYSVTYEYSPLWIAFRPTSWMWAIAIIAVIVAAVFTRPRIKAAPTPSRAVAAKPAVGQALSREDVRTFVDAYEEKNRITAELQTLEARAAHGRIPRRRYRVQSRNIEARLETLNRSIARVKPMMRSAGGMYADGVRQLEAEEVELTRIQMNLKNIDIRHETGELSLEDYRKEHAALERRKKKTEDMINNLLLRLRG